jgi:hypothetical protein
LIILSSKVLPAPTTNQPVQTGISSFKRLGSGLHRTD